MQQEPIYKETIIHLLEQVKDPEINTVSIIDLGMVENVLVNSEIVRIDILPTFLGCPALEFIKQNIINTIKENVTNHTIEVNFLATPAWTSDRVTEKGAQGLKKFGIAPPSTSVDENGNWEVSCPYCESKYVDLDNLFGPTACRSILYCKNCKNVFEAMKPLYKR